MNRWFLQFVAVVIIQQKSNILPLISMYFIVWGGGIIRAQQELEVKVPHRSGYDHVQYSYKARRSPTLQDTFPQGRKRTLGWLFY